MTISIHERELQSPGISEHIEPFGFHVVVCSLCMYVPIAGQLPNPDTDGSSSRESSPSPRIFSHRKTRTNWLFPFRVWLRKPRAALCLRTPDSSPPFFFFFLVNGRPQTPWRCCGERAPPVVCELSANVFKESGAFFFFFSFLSEVAAPLCDVI